MQDPYVYSSLPEYLGKVNRAICQKDIILGQYKTKESYYKFVLDQADYQRELEFIKYLIVEQGGEPFSPTRWKNMLSINKV